MIILPKQYISLLESALKIYSPSDFEKDISNFLFNTMKDLGFNNIRIDSADNVIGEIGSGNPTLLLCGHMDTVPGELDIKSSHGTLSGRGAVDAKSSLISMILAASSFCNNLPLGRIIVAAVTNEEGNGSGIREFLKSNIIPDFAIFGEPSGIEKITIGYKGRLSIKIICNTPSVHASAPWMSKNAIEELYLIWAHIKNNFQNEYSTRYKQITTCVTKIVGGSADNVMPGVCELTCDVRFPYKYDASQILDKIQAIINEKNNKHSDSSYSLEILDSTPAFEGSKSSLISRALGRSIIHHLGIKPQFVHKTGTGDMNVLGSSLQIPVVTYGPGNPHLSHTSDENISIDEFLMSIEIYKTAITNLIHLYGQNSISNC